MNYKLIKETFQKLKCSFSITEYDLSRMEIKEGFDLKPIVSKLNNANVKKKEYTLGSVYWLTMPNRFEIDTMNKGLNKLENESIILSEEEANEIKSLQKYFKNFNRDGYESRKNDILEYLDKQISSKSKKSLKP